MLDIDLITLERERRLGLWTELQAHSADDIEPTWLRERGLYGGAQGIWVDKARTGVVSPDGHGVTVSFLHTGRHYADELSDDGVIYHYPSTRRPAARDASEVQATKNAGALQVPLFIILPGRHSTGRRVRLGWVCDFDDALRSFLVLFGKEPVHSTTPAPDDPFTLLSSAPKKKALTTVRPGQQRFRFEVLKRYGPKCAVCGITEPRLLKAAHICGKAAGGADDWRNGMPLCSTHHDAFDAHMFAIHPETRVVHFAPEVSAATVGIVTEGLDLQHATPHLQALQWRWADAMENWQ